MHSIRQTARAVAVMKVMGLGLYLVKKYVELLAGDLTLESDKNSFFRARVELPATTLQQYRDAA